MSNAKANIKSNQYNIIDVVTYYEEITSLLLLKLKDIISNYGMGFITDSEYIEVTLMLTLQYKQDLAIFNEQEINDAKIITTYNSLQENN